MASPAFANEYFLRTVADSASKSCFVCHKAATKVLITPDNKDGKDFFYTCSSHLKDRGFASPVVDEKAEAEKKKAEELAREKEAIIKEYEAKAKKKGKDKKKDDAAKSDEAEKDQKLKELDDKAAAVPAAEDDEPRHFTLNRSFYQMRLDRRANIERAKRDQARINSTGFFPSTPTNEL